MTFKLCMPLGYFENYSINVVCVKLVEAENLLGPADFHRRKLRHRFKNG